MTSLERYMKAQDKIIAEDKEKTLISLGIIEREYAPDNKSSYVYSKYDYIDGERRYYREVAAKISDAEYAEVLRKKALVDAIKAKEKQESERKYAAQQVKIKKMWVPVFVKPNSEWSDSEKNDVPPTGKSKIAVILRVITWVSIVISIFTGMIMLFDDPMVSGLIWCCVGVESLLFFALAEMLDNLAEQTAILRGGMIYKEKSK